MDTAGHILIIDDDAALRLTMARILQRAGMEVTTAANGEEGLALLARQSYDLVYLDIRMPGMSGLKTLETIHASAPEIPVVLFTGQPDVNSAVEALRQGATDYLLKPLQPRTLIERTKSILARREKELRRHVIQLQMEALQTELKTLETEPSAQSGPAVKITEPDDRFIHRGSLTLDLQARRLTIQGRAINLPPTTFDYLLVLVRHAPNVVDYKTMVVEAQGYQAESREAQELVKWHIHHIRRAFEQEENCPIYLINERKIGYKLVTD